MQHLMFDIDGTLVESCEFDNVCYDEATEEVVGRAARADRSVYKHVSDEGILLEHLNQLGVTEIDCAIAEIKQRFIQKIKQHIVSEGTQAIAGALDFIQSLRQQPNISLSFATGGWRETALAKLDAAGFNTQQIHLASSDDHYARIEIMKTAMRHAKIGNSERMTYFGDGVWDKTACEALGWNFILIGNKCHHHQNVPDFQDETTIFSYL